LKNSQKADRRGRHDRTGALPLDELYGDAGMSERKTTNVEVRLPSRMGFEKVAMSTAQAVAKLMAFPKIELRISKRQSRRRASTPLNTATV